MYDVRMMSFLCFHQQKGLKAKNVIMTSNCKFMLVFELSGPNLASILNFSSISLQMADFSLFFGARSQIQRSTVSNFVAMATAQTITNWFDLQNVS